MRIFDGHNDFLLRLWQAPEQRHALWLQRNQTGHIDLPRLKEAGFAAGMFAIFVPPRNETVPAIDPAQAQLAPQALQRSYEDTLASAMAMAGHLHWMDRASDGAFRLCRSVAEIRAAWGAAAIAGVMHMEGAEALDPSGDTLHLFHAMGLRSLGPVWSRPNAYGFGVPFSFPGTPDIGPGLSAAGKQLVRDCNALKIIIDLSHLNAAGFDDVARLSDAPLVATHSNSHAVTPSPRNLTDRQLDQIRDSGGMVGLNFATFFLREDGLRSSDMTLEPMLRHLDHLISRLGEDHVGFGSDFDGALVPGPIGDVAGMPRLLEAMRAHGFNEALMAKLCHQNWLAVLERSWGG